MKNKLVINKDLSYSIHYFDEPTIVRIIRSGWDTSETFHVIVEYGDFESSHYEGLLYAEQIRLQFGIELPIEENNLNLICSKIPNDMELGKELRNKINIK